METSLTVTKKEFLETYSPKKMDIVLREVKTVKQALACTGGNLYAIRRTHGDATVSALIKLHLIDLNEILGLKCPWTELQIDAIAEAIVSEFSCLTFVDIALIFRRIKMGEIEAYDRLPMPSVLKAFKDYLNERCEEAERISIAEAEQYKSMPAERKSTQARKAWNIARKMDMEMRLTPDGQ